MHTIFSGANYASATLKLFSANVWHFGAFFRILRRKMCDFALPIVVAERGGAPCFQHICAIGFRDDVAFVEVEGIYAI